jgi:hypothetical protein
MLTANENNFGTDSGGFDETSKPIKEKNEAQQAELIRLRAELQSLQHEIWEQKMRRADLFVRLKDREQWIAQLEDSPFWLLVKPLWKLQRHFFKKRQPPEAATNLRRLIHGIDSFNSLETSDVLQITGWCFAHSAPQVVGVRAKIGATSYFAQYGLHRTNLPVSAREYPDAFHSGFRVTIPSPPSGTVVRLEAIALGGRWEYFSHWSAVVQQDTIATPER